MKKIIISDVTLRDGNHAVSHGIGLKTIQEYCIFAERTNISIVEVGHGNGLGASSLSIGRSNVSDVKALNKARKFLKKTNQNQNTCSTRTQVYLELSYFHLTNHVANYSRAR